jgi:predicted nucleic acid-binding protein
MAKRSVRLFLDSNVILSGLLSERGAPRIILDLLNLGFPFLTGSTGKYNLIEIERNLKKGCLTYGLFIKDIFPS